MNIKKKIEQKINGLIKRSYWYNNIMFPDCKKFWNQKTFNLDWINLGSNSGKYGFDYSDLNIKAANWAMGPQSLVADFEILKNYSSFLKPGGIVVIPLCPFSCLGGSTKYMADKYYTIVRLMSIPNSNYLKRQDILRIMRNPIKYYPLIEIVRDMKIITKKILHYKNTESIVSDKQLEANAKQFIDGWKFEFSILDFKNELILKNKDAYADSVDILSEMISFCLERGFKPVLTIPPVSKHLLSYFTPEMKKLFIYDFIKKANNQNIPFIDFFDHPDFKDKNEYFLNSLFLNQKGAKAYTSALLKQIVSTQFRAIK